MPKRIFELLYPRQVDDKRKITKQMIDDIVRNSAGEKYPISVGHDAAMGFFGDDVQAAGQFGDLTQDEKNMLTAGVALRAETEKAYQDNAYPGWSVGIYKTKDRGWQMDHLALLGSVGAAFKDLKDRTGSDNFSIIDQSEHCMEIECFSGDPEKNKTLWLLQCVPRQPATVETPAAFSSAPNKGDPEMDPKEFEAYKAKQEQEKAERDQQFAKLQADNDKLQADNQARLDAETTRLSNEFTGIKSVLLKAAADKGVNEPARETLSKSLDAYDAHYAGGVITKELFDALIDVFGQLKPKLEPGEIDTGDEEPDEFVLQQKWTGDQAVAAITE